MNFAYILRIFIPVTHLTRRYETKRQDDSQVCYLQRNRREVKDVCFVVSKVTRCGDNEGPDRSRQRNTPHIM